ncbi:hypothetical protein SteCoe_11157 [Stentor coeruleus]|uniref:Translin-associated factor X-interacting protein 1 N-terminal domain-containing protein n=1 Tax=Stentor coeruleus TaxID=5963 RepID=A0A1R2CDS0_9CILI|nr:hypothetical protein SteCoe_11157 [Stentor coeruleus]
MSKIIRLRLLPEKLQHKESKSPKRDHGILSNNSKSIKKLVSKKFFHSGEESSNTLNNSVYLKPLRAIENSTFKTRARKNHIIQPLSSASEKKLKTHADKKKNQSISVIHTDYESQNTKNLEVCETFANEPYYQETKNYAELSFDICQQDFEAVIAKCSNFNNILRSIKQEYEQQLSNKTKELEIKQKIIAESEQSKSFLIKQLQKASFQNTTMLAKNKQLSVKYTLLYEQLTKISDFNTNSIEKTEENWNKLIRENKLSQSLMQKLTQELTYYKEKAIKMMKLLNVMEKKGYPLDDIYKKEVKSVKVAKRNVIVEESDEDRILKKFKTMKEFFEGDLSQLNETNSEYFNSERDRQLEF